ncbi:hypothetical protein [Rhodothermus profundi]|uniref:Uncharacterized protein n=1 Tax=Rhodothermus profundi TaxID=633813 RepID=A0A1M6SML9_9BACT|nr:hypothetical protein [Rhodothermus profundi]SHK45945.1 hypothetical protein SAMN04488087_1150 [Rhodothermus profundi]
MRTSFLMTALIQAAPATPRADLETLAQALNDTLVADVMLLPEEPALMVGLQVEVDPAEESRGALRGLICLLHQTVMRHLSDYRIGLHIQSVMPRAGSRPIGRLLEKSPLNPLIDQFASDLT